MAEIITLDDVEDAVVLIKKILTRRGHIVHTFTEEEDTIRYAYESHIDLAILYIKLKKMRGIVVRA
jgi:two-component SAPR family response regulator